MFRWLSVALFVLAVAGCSSAPATPEPPKPPPTSTPTPTPVARVDDKNGSSCPCTAPYECRHVSGRQPDSGREECWIPCGENQSCPSGLSCEMIYDGPGHVCLSTDR